MTSSAAAPHPLDRQARLMLQGAMLLFVWTIGIGILNGLDIVDFTTKQLLSHLHGGTLGWLTLGILSFTLWLFGAGDLSDRSKQFIQACGVLAFVAVTAYVFAFATTAGIVRPVAGTVTLLALIGFAGWAAGRTRHVTLTVPRLLALVGLATSVLGGGFGVFNGLALALSWGWAPESLLDAHPGTMEVGFVLPVAMGLAEWGLRQGMPEQRASRAGLVQAALMFIAFVLLLFFTLAGLEEQTGLATTVALVGVIIFWVRIWAVARRTSILQRLPGRHSLMGGVLLGVTFVYVTVIIQQAEGDFDNIPRGQLLAFIHLMGIGTTTNTLLAYVISLSRRAVPASGLDDAVFWGVNLGVIGFATVLTIDVGGGIYAFVPVMGAALLLAVGTHLVHLSREPDVLPAPGTAAGTGVVVPET